MTKEQATKLIQVYGKAWETQDPDLITTIFTEDGNLHDPHEPNNVGKDAIRAYWISKVVNDQKDIKFKILNVWVDGDTVIAEWEAKFTEPKRNTYFELRTVAIFTVKGDKFSSNREYYISKKTLVK